MKKLFSKIFVVFTAYFLTHAALAGEADVVGVKISQSSGDSYSFEVTVSHGDTGWEHYADRWDVIDGTGKILGSRVLAHPHVNEQPFTRGLGGVKIPRNVTSVTIRAHDKVHGLGGKEMVVKVPR